MVEEQYDNKTEIALARLDERLKALVSRLDRADIYTDKAIKLAADELARRLDVLNHAHEDAVQAQAATVPREVFDNYKKEVDIRLRKIEETISNLLGKLWLPFIIIGSIGFTIGGIIVSMFNKLGGR